MGPRGAREHGRRLVAVEPDAPEVQDVEHLHVQVGGHLHAGAQGTPSDVRAAARVPGTRRSRRCGAPTPPRRAPPRRWCGGPSAGAAPEPPAAPSGAAKAAATADGTPDAGQGGPVGGRRTRGAGGAAAPPAVPAAPASASPSAAGRRQRPLPQRQEAKGVWDWRGAAASSRIMSFILAHPIPLSPPRVPRCRKIAANERGARRHGGWRRDGQRRGGRQCGGRPPAAQAPFVSAAANAPFPEKAAKTRGGKPADASYLLRNQNGVPDGRARATTSTPLHGQLRIGLLESRASQPKQGVSTKEKSMAAPKEVTARARRPPPWRKGMRRSWQASSSWLSASPSPSRRTWEPRPFPACPTSQACAPHFPWGTATILMHCAFIAFQILVLRKDYRPIQLLQLPVAFLFGFLTDFGVWALQGVTHAGYVSAVDPVSGRHRAGGRGREP